METVTHGGAEVGEWGEGGWEQDFSIDTSLFCLDFE